MDVNSCSRVTVQCHCLSEANTSIFRNRSLSSFQATSSDLNWKVEQVSCTIFYSATASVSWICIFEPEPLVVIKEQAMLCRQNTWNVLIIFFIPSNINAYHSQKRHCPPPWSVRMSACQRRQGCSTSPFGQRTFATRPPSKAEDMGLSQGSFVSFLEERVKEVFTSIHVSVESTKPAEVYTTRRWHSWELRRELAMSFETDMKYM